MCERQGKLVWYRLLPALLLCGCHGLHADPSGQSFADIERGRYLTAAADCDACHTDPADNRPFAGGRVIETPFGLVAAANITPDPETGIGNWTDQQFDNALRLGQRPDGSRLYPAMPYPYYTRMTAQDIQAIRSYLRTLTPVHHAVRTNRLPFPFNIRAAMRLWDALYFKPGVLESNPTQSAEWNRGAYLVEGPGHCAACHTPKNMLGGDRNKQRLRGYSIQGWFAPDISNDPFSGIGKWSGRDIVDYLKSGHNRWAGAAGSMAEEVTHSSANLTEADLAAIATYLETQPGQTPSATPLSSSNPTMAAGAAIYADLCSACHRQDGTGSEFLFPNLAASGATASRETTSIVRVILQGAATAATHDEPTGPAMPAYGWQLNDAQIASVATYIRNSWGHAAAATTPEEVHKARQQLQASANQPP